MKVVAFNGSPNPEGNTAILLMKVLSRRARGDQHRVVQVGGNKFRLHGVIPVLQGQGQALCDRRDIVNDCIAKMIEADAIVMGTPTYFANMTPEDEGVDRPCGIGGGRQRQLFARKIGAAVAVNRRGGAVHAVDAINHMFLMSRMIVPGSIYWNFGVGMRPGDVENDTEAVENMHDLGETIAWLVKSLCRSDGQAVGAQGGLI